MFVLELQKPSQVSCSRRLVTNQKDAEIIGSASSGKRDNDRSDREQDSRIRSERVVAARRQLPVSVAAVWFDAPMMLADAVFGGMAESNKLHNVKRELAQ